MQQAVRQGGLAVVDMSNNAKVPDKFGFHANTT